MPLVWKIDAANKLVVAVANGDVTGPEMERYLDSIIENEALAYRKVFDAHGGDTSMTADDVLPLAVRMRSLHELGAMGPLAVVLPPGRGKRLHRALGMIATAKRPMRVFEDPVLAYRWLAKQALPEGTTGQAEADNALEGSARARQLAAHIRRTARLAAAEAGKMRAVAKDEEVLYRGQGEITHRGVPLNVCVKRVGQSWNFLCCGPDRQTIGTLLTLAPEEITASLAEGQRPLENTLAHIKGLALAGTLDIPAIPSGGR